MPSDSSGSIIAIGNGASFSKSVSWTRLLTSVELDLEVPSLRETQARMSPTPAVWKKSAVDLPFCAVRFNQRHAKHAGDDSKRVSASGGGVIRKRKVEAARVKSKAPGNGITGTLLRAKITDSSMVLRLL